jgi:lysophospholipase L1-like esterase
VARNGRFDRREIVRSFLLLSMAIVVSLLLGEAAVRAFMPQFLRPVFRERVDGAFYLRADLHVRVYSPGEFDTPANTTLQRLRARAPYTPIPSPGTYRIAVIGDSFVFGTGAQDNETYPSVLEAALGVGRQHSVEVLNAGIPNSGVGDQALWYHRWVSAFRPDLVILTVYGGNDVSDEIHDSKFVLAPDGSAVPLDLRALTKQGGLESRIQSVVLKIPGYNFLTQHSHLLYAVRSMVTAAFMSDDGAETEKAAAEQAMAKIAGEVYWLRQKVEATGAKLVVVYIPSRDAVRERGGVSAHLIAHGGLDERLSSETSRDGIPFLDLTPAIAAKMRAEPNGVYFEHDDHMRPEGYRLVGEEVARFLAGGRDRLGL